MSPGSDLVKIVPEQMDQPTEDDPPLLAFLLQERQSAVVLLQRVHGDLSRISKVIRGSVLLTTDVKENAAALLKHEVGAWFLPLGCTTFNNVVLFSVTRKT